MELELKSPPPPALTLGMDIPLQRQNALSSILDGLNRLTETATPESVPLDEARVGELIDQALSNQPAKLFRIAINEIVSQEIEGPMPLQFPRVLKLMAARMNVMLVGPAGCGKTTLAAKCAQALGLDFGHITLSAGMSEGALTGRLLPTGDGGQFVYSRSEFVRLYEEGGVFLLDEMDAADENTLLVLNTALSNGHMSVPARIDKPTAKRHDDFVCVAAANTFGNGADRMYVGRNQLDAATLDRFRAGTVTCDYDAGLEDALVNPMVLAWGRKMRAKILEGSMRRVCSTRFLVDATRLLAMQCADWDGLRDSYFADWSADDKRRVGDLAPSKPYTPAR